MNKLKILLTNCHQDKQPTEFVEAVKALVTNWRADGVKELSSL